MPKIVVSLAQRRRLRRVSLLLYFKRLVFCTCKSEKSVSKNKSGSKGCFFVGLKSIRRRRTLTLGILVQFRQFRHFLK